MRRQLKDYNMLEKVKRYITISVNFVTRDIWRVTPTDAHIAKRVGYHLLKTFILAIRNIKTAKLNTQASALTYRTLLSIVPLLAVLFAIARGFGFQNIMQSQLFGMFEGQQDVMTQVMEFIDSSLEYAQGGVFVGVGVLLLVYTVINLLSSIEDSFNQIWSIKKGRSYYRLFTDYLALIVIAPIFLLSSAGLSVILSATKELNIIGWVATPVVALIPYAITMLLFTFVYMYIPNTRVKFGSALLAGVFAGICFQIFQVVYISGQIWISKYNAIYGSFAALPLFLMWLQVSWFICLFGVELTFANQNVKRFEFEKETDNISRRYSDFVILAVMTLIVKRFLKGETPYTAADISENHKIPSRLTYDVIDTLLNIGFVIETPTNESLVSAYIPSSDINQITIGSLFEAVADYGSEDFKINKNVDFAAEWTAIMNIRQTINNNEGQILLKDL